MRLCRREFITHNVGLYVDVRQNLTILLLWSMILFMLRSLLVTIVVSDKGHVVRLIIPTIWDQWVMIHAMANLHALMQMEVPSFMAGELYFGS